MKEKKMIEIYTKVTGKMY